MKKFLKITGAIIAVLLLLTGGYVLFNLEHFQRFPKILPTYYAKEFCTCFFVLKRDEKFCHNFARQYIPIDDFKLDRENKRVTVTGLGETRSVKFVSERYGCVIESEN